MEEFTKQESVLFFALAGAIIVIAIVLVALILLSKSPEPYTELYFDASAVPVSGEPGESLAVGFFVENHEDMAMDYTYEILVGGESVKSGTISLADGEKRAMQELVQLSGRDVQKVEVLLVNSFQEEYSIFFWVNAGQGP